jgi:hypothetical protein
MSRLLPIITLLCMVSTVVSIALVVAEAASSSAALRDAILAFTILDVVLALSIIGLAFGRFCTRTDDHFR